MHRLLQEKIKSGTNEGRSGKAGRRPATTAGKDAPEPRRRCLNEAAHKLAR